MSTRYSVPITIAAQPDDVTCGPTCLHAIYHRYGDAISLQTVIDETPQLACGGTMAVHLGVHALQRGYRARMYTYDLQLFDPTWFGDETCDIGERLRAQMLWKGDRHQLVESSKGYLRYLELGGELRFDDLSGTLINRYLADGQPILTGLSSTHLYRSMREYGPEGRADDIRGKPSGHFVIINGVENPGHVYSIADPFAGNPLVDGQYYHVSEIRLLAAILLGTTTFDANLLILSPPSQMEHDDA